jgi:aminoglycoside phosphotransferase (APT) family kinase protein
VSDAAARSAAALARRAGEMLAAFQSVDPPGELAGTTGAAVRRRYLADMARRSQRLEAAGVDVAELLAQWRVMESVALEPLRIQHSDMGPWNILVASDGALSLFDFHNFTLGHPAYDLAYLHEALEGMRRLSLLDGTAIGLAQRALLDGYTASARPSTDASPALDPVAWRAFRIMHVAYFAYPFVTRRRSPQLLVFGARDGRAFVSEWIHRVVAG